MRAKLDPALILADLRRVCRAVGERRFSLKLYLARGRHAVATLVNHYGSWSAAVQAAGLTAKRRGRPSEESQCARTSTTPTQKLESIRTWKHTEPLLEHRRGRRRCLKCDRVFSAWDVRKNRLCESCALRNTRMDESQGYRVWV